MVMATMFEAKTGLSKLVKLAAAGGDGDFDDGAGAAAGGED